MTRDDQIEPKYRKQMNTLASILDEVFNGKKRGKNRDTGFVLLTFPFGDDPAGRVNYISNGVDRKDIVVLFKEMITRFEGQPEMKGHA